MTTIPSGSQYESILDNYLGEAFADQQDGLFTKKDSLWSQFLLENNLTSSNPLVLAQDPTVLAKFMDFVQNTYDSLQKNALSPNEIARRELMFSVYDLMVLMLQVLQQNVGVVAENVAFLARYQKEYSTMMGRVSGSVYIAGSKSLPDVNTADLSKWLLGYGQVTMEDYIDTAINAASTGTTQDYSIDSLNTSVPLPPDSIYKFQQGVVFDALAAVPYQELIAAGPATRTAYANYAPQAMNTLSFKATPNSVTFEYHYKQQYDATVRSYFIDGLGQVQFNSDNQRIAGFYDVPVTSPTVTFPPNATDDQKKELTKAAFMAFLNQPVPNSDIVPPGFAPFPGPFAVIFSNIPPAQSLTVFTSMTEPINMWNLSNSLPFFQVTRNISRPWNFQYNRVYTYTTGDREKAEESAASRRRASKNSLLQQYVTDSQQRRQIISNQSDAMNSQQDQARTGFNQAAGLLKSMIGQMSTIMTSIFEVK